MIIKWEFSFRFNDLHYKNNKNLEYGQWFIREDGNVPHHTSIAHKFFFDFIEVCIINWFIFIRGKWMKEISKNTEWVMTQR